MLPSIHEIKGHSPSAAYQAVRSRLELLKLLDNRPGERAKGVSVCSDGQTLDAVVLTREDGLSTAVQRVTQGGCLAGFGRKSQARKVRRLLSRWRRVAMIAMDGRK